MALGDVYKKIGGTWTLQGNIRGATGATGSTGAQGATGATGAAGVDGTNGTNGTNGIDGADGALWLTGASATGGVDNDMFLITS